MNGRHRSTGWLGRSFVVAMAVGFACALASAPASANLYSWQGMPARQVVIFGVLATPGGTTMDPKISPAVGAQLRRALPNHSFKLVKIQSEQVLTGQSITCNLGDGFVATSLLLNPLDPNGKVQMKFELSHNNTSQFQTIVLTPPDQFNYFDKMLPNNNRLLLGVGAR